ncbi:MAG: TonB-dependent receptor [Gemmatimonadota bacterium]|nr:TonB-dependent receptor [Gemmatimonadota bacterium]
MRISPPCTRACIAAVAILLLPTGARAQRACEDALVAAPPEGWTPPLDIRSTLHAHDVSLREALDRLSAASGVRLAYSADFLPVDSRVCVAADAQPVGAILAALLRGGAVEATVVAGRVVLSPTSATVKTASPATAGASVLERVVVTGNAIGVPRRSLVVGMEIIDGEQLRRQAQGSLSDVLDAAVPGLWSWTQGPSALVSQYGGIRGASSFSSSSPKIYIDGVEVANPLLVSQLNPDVVDRIEVIRGPQGSALYGSDAISGVINVLTRHDAGTTSTPMLQIRSMAGAASSDYAPGLVPTHEQRLTLRTGTNVKSAGLAMTYGQTGALFPSSESRQLAAMGDARVVLPSETLTMSARIFDKSAGAGRNPLIPVPATVATDSTEVAGTAITSDAAAQSVREYTVSTAAAFATDGRWTHTLLAGVDGYHLKNVAGATNPVPSPLDSALRAAQGYGDRLTVRECSVAHFGEEDGPLTTFTVGVEQSVLRQAGTVATQVPGAEGERYNTAVDRVVQTWNHNTGVLSQVSTSIDDALFLTAGLRVERNDAFSGNNRYPLLPMVGIAAVRDLGGAEVKWRAAYGRGIRPPQTPARSASTGYANNTAYTPGGVLPALDPEVQAGYETGVELYFGRAFSMQLTRFDQHVTGLIQNVSLAIDTLMHNGSIQRRVRYQLQNVGEITNTGWELQGSTTRGPFTLSSAFSTVDSRVRALANGYLGDLRPGDRMLAVPARTFSATASYQGASWSAALGATRANDWIDYDRVSLGNWYLARSPNPSREPTGTRLRTYWREYDGQTHLRLTTSRDLVRGVSLLVIGENLLGGQLGEPDNVTIRPGRTVTAGLRASF